MPKSVQAWHIRCDSDEWETTSDSTMAVPMVASSDPTDLAVIGCPTAEEKGLARRRAFYDALLDYKIQDTPDASGPFYHDILERIMLFLPPDRDTLLAVSQVKRTWRFMSNYLPVWSHFHWNVPNQKKSPGFLEYKKSRTDPSLTRDRLFDQERVRRSVVHEHRARPWRYHVLDTVGYTLLVLLSCALGFIISYFGHLDDDLKCGSLCLVGLGIALLRFAAQLWFLDSVKESYFKGSFISKGEFAWRENVLRIAFVVTIFIGTSVSALTGRRLSVAQDIKDAGYAVLDEANARLPCSQQPAVLPYVRLVKPLSQWEFDASLPVFQTRRLHFLDYDESAYYTPYSYQEVVADVRTTSCGYVTGNTIQYTLYVLLRQGEYNTAKSGSNIFESDRRTDFRGMAHTPFFNLAGGETPMVNRNAGRTYQIIDPQYPAKIPDDAEDRYRRHVGYVMAVIFGPAALFLLLGAWSYLPDSCESLAYGGAVIGAIIIFNPIMLLAWGIVCLIPTHAEWIMCDGSGGGLMVGLAIGGPVTVAFVYFGCIRKR